MIFSVAAAILAATVGAAFYTGRRPVVADLVVAVLSRCLRITCIAGSRPLTGKVAVTLEIRSRRLAERLVIHYQSWPDHDDIAQLFKRQLGWECGTAVVVTVAQEGGKNACAAALVRGWVVLISQFSTRHRHEERIVRAACRARHAVVRTAASDLAGGCLRGSPSPSA